MTGCRQQDWNTATVPTGHTKTLGFQALNLDALYARGLTFTSKYRREAQKKRVYYLLKTKTLMCNSLKTVFFRLTEYSVQSHMSSSIECILNAIIVDSLAFSFNLKLDLKFAWILQCHNFINREFMYVLMCTVVLFTMFMKFCYAK